MHLGVVGHRIFDFTLGLKRKVCLSEYSLKAHKNARPWCSICVLRGKWMKWVCALQSSGGCCDTMKVTAVLLHPCFPAEQHWGQWAMPGWALPLPDPTRAVPRAAAAESNQMWQHRGHQRRCWGQGLAADLTTGLWQESQAKIQAGNRSKSKPREGFHQVRPGNP